MPSILLGTTDGLHTVDDRGVVGPVHHAGRAVTSLAPNAAEVWAVLDGTEVWHSPDMDRWSHVGDLVDHRGTCIAVADEEDVLVGSSEARLFRIIGDGLQPVVPFDQAEGRSAWYTPWGGPPDTRSIAEWDEAVYVNVHVGGILRTEDRGQASAASVLSR